MKKRNIVVIILGLIVIVVLLAYNRNKAAVVTQNGDLVAPQTMCYLRELDTPAGKDYSYVQATLAEDGTTTGVFNLIPAEKDKLKGPFTGTWTKEGAITMLNVVQTYSAEGTTAQEARRIKITPAGASVGFGETVADNDVYIYKDENAITYGDVMSPIACDTVPVAAK